MPSIAKTYTESRPAALLPLRVGSERQLVKRMKRLWRVILLLTLAVALPLRAQGGPWASCCAAGLAHMPAPMTQVSSLDSDTPHDCNSPTGCAGDRHSSGPSRVPCTASACGTFVGTPLTTSSDTGAWTSVLVAHPEFACISFVGAPLERPPNGVSL